MGSYPTVSPLPTEWSAVCFLWRCPRSFLHRALPGILPCGARTFLPAHTDVRPAIAWTTCSIGRSHGGSDPGKPQAENDEPQPQVLVTFGLPNLKPDP